MIHHVSVGTNDLAGAKKFYDAVLATLGLRCLNVDAESVDYGVSEIIFSLETPTNGKPAAPGNGVHIAFIAGNRAIVQEFFATAIAHGGTSDGDPGVRPKYDDHYYGAFVLDPEGNKLEAMTMTAK